MKCKSCGFENRADILFCEECGVRFETKPCPDCRFENRLDVSYCEECGHSFAIEAVVETKACPDCGIENRLDVNFCEECGHAFAVEKVVIDPSIETKACPDCGFENRSDVNFCEECGSSFIVEPVPAGRRARRKPKREWSRKRRLWTWVGGSAGALAGALAVAAVLIWAVPFLMNPPVDDFTPIQQEVEAVMLSSAQEIAEQVAPWADLDSAEVEMIDSENGQTYMITFEGEKGNDGFGPRMMILIDPLSGESTYVEAP